MIVPTLPIISGLVLLDAALVVAVAASTNINDHAALYGFLTVVVVNITTIVVVVYQGSQTRKASAANAAAAAASAVTVEKKVDVGLRQNDAIIEKATEIGVKTDGHATAQAKQIEAARVTMEGIVNKLIPTAGGKGDRTGDNKGEPS